MERFLQLFASLLWNVFVSRSAIHTLRTHESTRKNLTSGGNV